MAAAAVADPVSVPTSLGAREQLDLAAPALNLQKLESPQVSIHQCAQRYGPQALRSLFEKLVERGTVAGFEEVNLQDNEIGDEGAAYLAKGLTGNTALKRLLLARCGFSGPGFEALAALGTSPQLEQLVCSSNPCPASAAAVLARGLKGSPLRSLALAACRLGDEGAAQLAPLAELPKLEHLSLCYNRMGPAAAPALLRLLEAPQLSFLDLSGNSLGPEGAEALASGLKRPGRHLTRLGLGQNQLRLAGCRVLAKHFLEKEGEQLEYLDLRHNGAGYRGLCELRESLGRPMEGPEGWLLLFGTRQLLLNAH